MEVVLSSTPLSRYRVYISQTLHTITKNGVKLIPEETKRTASGVILRQFMRLLG